jgi:phosphate transport system substrate-binding protein
MKLSNWKGAAPAVFAVLLTGSLALAAGVQVDPDLPAYGEAQKASGVSGNFKSVGSDTMQNLMTYWAEGFCRLYPSLRPEIEGKGSGTAPPALINGQSTFGPMSRKMKEKEVQAFEDRYGYKPTYVPTSIDMLAVYVNKDNPIEGLTLPQLDAIFSKNRKGGYPEEITTWGQLGLTGEWANRPISLYGRNSASGTYGFFKEHALFKGDYKDTVKEQPGSAGVVGGVAGDIGGIGYSGIGYKTADVRVVPLAEGPGSPMVAAVADNAYTGEYPLARFLYLYVNRKPGAQLDPLRGEFLKYVFSRNGQEDVLKAGYYPITATIANKALADLGIATR